MSENDPLVARGFAALDARNVFEADRIADVVLAREPEHAGALHLKGICLRALGWPDEARARLEAAAANGLDEATAKTAIGLTHLDQRRYGAAEACFLRVRELAPDDAATRMHLGDLYRFSMDRVRAIEAYESALALEPRHETALYYLCQLCELAGRHGEARAYAERLLEVNPASASAAGVIVRAVHAADGADAAVERARAFLDEPAMARAASRPLLLALGDALHARGDFREAFEAYAHGGAEAQTRYAPQFGPQSPHAFARAEVLRDAYRGLAPRRLAPVEDGARAPAFLIGFPRSGTTLLEQILAAHPDIETSNERANLTPIQNAAGNTVASVAALLGAPTETLAPLRAAYWDQTGRPEGAGGGRVYIDKSPAGSPWVGMAATVFPEARVILALRDPRDCVVSGFRQNFRMNHGMYRMLSLESAAVYYDALMGAIEAARAARPDIAVCEVRYEDVTADVEREARRVIDFLGLPWRDEVLSYRARVDPAAVSTPSARRVAKPVDRASVAAWRNYAFAMKDACAILEPWVERWGYEPSGALGDGNASASSPAAT